MIDQILVPLDGSSLAERVLPHLFALAKPFNSRVTLLRVMSHTQAGEPNRRIDPLDWQLREAEARSYLNRLTSELQGSGLNVSSTLLHGDPATTIIDFVNSEDLDLILLSSHGLSGLTGWNISSVVQKTVIRVNKPIMIVRAYQPAPDVLSEAQYKKILTPLDGSQRAESVLPLASTLADFHDAELLLAHVVRKPEVPRRGPPSLEDEELADTITEHNRLEASRYMKQLEGRFPGDLRSQIFVGTDVADTLHELVDRENPDLVVMSAHGYTGSTQWPYGSLALNFIAFGTSPLLIVRDLPEDHATLLTLAEEVTKERQGH
ncbi:MAG: universal stress protein [Anaerolineales bacterium]|nr:universal stress protein [Anaerolineales bacterium]